MQVALVIHLALGPAAVVSPRLVEGGFIANVGPEVRVRGLESRKGSTETLLDPTALRPFGRSRVEALQLSMKALLKNCGGGSYVDQHG